jgi:hypothetical protein
MKQFITLLFFLFVYLYGFSQQPLILDDGENFYSYNYSNCTYRFMGNIPGASFADIAFTPDGKFWGISDGFLYQIDTITISPTLIGQSKGTEGVSLVALNDSILLDEFQDSLWGINTRTAQSYDIGYIGYSAAGDLSWFGTNLYMTTEKQLIKIVLNADYTAILNVTPVNSIDNPIPLCYGLATVPINGTPALIGAYIDAYNISPIDGTFQLLCPSIGAATAAGAASLSYPGALPVNLLSFTSSIDNKVVKLQWQTKLEINSSYFLIERSSDGVNFSGIGKVDAVGNSSNERKYSFIDNSPNVVNYYRLKEVDLDGKYVYSKILEAQLSSVQELNILGNPVRNVLQIQITNSLSQKNYLSIFDFSGRRLKTFNVENGVQNIDISFLTSGTYFLQLIDANGNFFEKAFVKSN